MNVITLLLALLLSATVCAAPAAAVQADAGQGKVREALTALRAGGYVLIVRHGTTIPTAADTNPFDLSDCTKQRLLSDTGRRQAKTVGRLLEKEQVRLGRAFASRYCRAIDTANLIAEFSDGPKVSPTDDFTEGGQVVTPLENKRRAEALRAAAGRRPAPSTNDLIVSHRPNIMEAFGSTFFDIGEGEIAVFRPIGTAPGYQLMWRLTLDELATYAHARDPSRDVGAAHLD